MRLRSEPASDDEYAARAARVLAAGGRIGQYGTPVSVHTCSVCGTEFTVCPPVMEETFGTGCLEPTCGSYDPARDAEVWFAP